MARILITGASGFLGGALGRRLRSLGHRVIGWSRRPPREGAADEHVLIDIARETLPLQSFDAVVHCAALASPWAPRAAFLRNNVDATRRLLAVPTGHFVFISSSSVHYTWGDQFGIREIDAFPDEAINEYARTKRLAESAVRASATKHAILRPRAIFGPEDTVLFPRILRAARAGALPRITREDGLPTLADLIYIDNLTHFIASALERQSEGVFNLTNAEPTDTFQFLSKIFADLGYPPIRRSVSSRWAFRAARALEALSGVTANRWEPPLTRFGVEVMVHSKTFDVSKATAEFGAPPVPLEEARRNFVSWQRTQDALHR